MPKTNTGSFHFNTRGSTQADAPTHSLTHLELVDGKIDVSHDGAADDVSQVAHRVRPARKKQEATCRHDGGATEGVRGVPRHSILIYGRHGDSGSRAALTRCNDKKS